MGDSESPTWEADSRDSRDSERARACCFLDRRDRGSGERDSRKSRVAPAAKFLMGQRLAVCGTSGPLPSTVVSRSLVVQTYIRAKGDPRLEKKKKRRRQGVLAGSSNLFIS